MSKYQITVSYRALLTILVSAANEIEAKEMVLEKMKIVKKKMSEVKSINIEEDNYRMDGILNTDAISDNLTL